jgi:hypothetical protein
MRRGISTDRRSLGCSRGYAKVHHLAITVQTGKWLTQEMTLPRKITVSDIACESSHELEEAGMMLAE